MDCSHLTLLAFTPVKQIDGFDIRVTELVSCVALHLRVQQLRTSSRHDSIHAIES